MFSSAPTTTPAATSKAGNRNQRDVVQFATSKAASFMSPLS